MCLLQETGGCVCCRREPGVCVLQEGTWVVFAAGGDMEVCLLQEGISRCVFCRRGHGGVYAAGEDIDVCLLQEGTWGCVCCRKGREVHVLQDVKYRCV